MADTEDFSWTLLIGSTTRRRPGYKHYKEVSVYASDHHWLALCYMTENCGHNQGVCVADCLLHINASSL